MKTVHVLRAAVLAAIAVLLLNQVNTSSSSDYGQYGQYGADLTQQPATRFNYLSGINPTQPFQPVVRSLGCASAHFTSNKGQNAFFVLHGSCFAGDEPQATWLYSVGPNTWFRSEPIFDNGTDPSRRQDHGIASLPDETGIAMFGGRTSSSSDASLYSDTWLYNGDDLCWQALENSAKSPSERYASGLVGCTMSHGCAANSGVYLFGGLSTPTEAGNIAAATSSSPPTMLNDLWRLDADRAAGLAHWSQLTPVADPVHGFPAARGYPRTAVGQAAMFVCGGLQYDNGSRIMYLLDLWQLTMSNNTWRRLSDIDVSMDPYDLCSVAGLSYVPSDQGVTPTLIALLSCTGDLEMRVWSYTIGTDKWDGVWYVKGDSLPPPFVQPIAQEHSEQVYIYGGIDSQSRVYTGLWVLRYNTKDSTCVQAAAPDILPPIVSQHSASYLEKTRALYVYGGVYPTAPALPGLAPSSINIADERLHVYSVQESMWTSVLRPGIARLAAHTMISWGNSLYLFGGFDTDGVSQSGLWKFNIASLTWSNASSPTYTFPPRQAHAAALDPERGLMYVYGGLYSDALHKVMVLGDLLVYDLAESTWSEIKAVGAPPPGVFGHSMVFIDGSLYVLGGASIDVTADGYNVSVVEDMFWRFNLKTRQWENLCYWVDPSLFHPLLAGRFFTTASAKDSSILMFVGDCCDPICMLTKSDVPTTVELNSHTIAQRCCSKKTGEIHPRVWLLSTTDHLWMELKMSYSSSAHHSPIRHAGHSLTNVEDKFFVHGGLCRGEDDNTLCSLALPTYVIQPGCNAGWYSQHVYSQACQPCPAENYSMTAGSIGCESCPLGSFSQQNGSTSSLQCSKCPRDICNDAGDCSVNSATHEMECNCDFGYDGMNRCRVPAVYLGIGGAAVFILLLLVLTCFLVQKYRSKRRQDEEKERQLRTCKREIASLNSVWRIEADELKLSRRIDEETPGSFGEVWMAVYRDMQVAYKQLRTQVLVADAQALMEFQREAEFMRTIRHPNIVLFIGAGVMPPSSIGAASIPFLVVEYMPRGTLLSVLNDKTVHIDHQQRLRMALDIAKGMRFLHGLTPPRVHRDLKSANLLVSDHFVVKVSDFGSARWIQSIEECQQVSSTGSMTRSMANSTTSTPINARFLTKSRSNSSREYDTERAPLLQPDALMSSDVGTLLWSAPEVLSQSAYGAAADVFSYSIVLWELYTRKEPYSHTGYRFSFDFSRYILEGGRPEMESNGWPKDYRALVEECWMEGAERRPKFVDIVPNLDNQLERCFSQM
ncbi:uncharacterized protein LOC135819654 [Sycon ciliatum]|uniref:uncharacterized protein LOC135819654 n=1 Tax=Sycon ciliatum TaxID=27933 RepID=UPI0020AA1978|eukprot:scpid6097/ scgid8436/ Probable serine/threonine-protein kinase drkC; Receptor-like kinase 3; Receptor-like kinase C; Vesicle-associated receptor tyrosine kinase-like protein 3